MSSSQPDPETMIELAVVLPTLNECENLTALIERLHERLGGIGWEAIIVDDNSADGTADLARELARKDPRIRVIERFGRRGLASAAIEGMCATSAPYVAVMDADHQHDPALLAGMLDAVRSGRADISVASRFAKGASADGLDGEGRKKASAWANRIARRITGVELTDPMSGYFLIETGRVRKLAASLTGIGFKIMLDIFATSPEPLRVREFPLQFAERRAGVSKLDRVVAFEFLVGLYERSFGRLIPTRFAMFGTVGALGVGVHLVVLSLLFLIAGNSFVAATATATFVAMTFNFWLNNWLTYRDLRLRGFGAVAKGWAGFCLTCSIGAFANVAAATLLEGRGVYWLLAAAVGILVGAVWNYALSSRFVWGQFD